MEKTNGAELLKTLGDFTSRENWDKFFSIRGSDDTFEWYAEWPYLRDPLLLQLSASNEIPGVAGAPAEASASLKILVPGCGNSRLSEHLYDAGFCSITNIDFSKVVISDMLRRNVRSRPDMRWRVMDMTDMQVILQTQISKTNGLTGGYHDTRAGIWNWDSKLSFPYRRTKKEAPNRLLCKTEKLGLIEGFKTGNMANKDGSEGPLWEFMENFGKMQGGGGNCNFRCKLCNTCLKGNYYRIKGYLLLIPNRGVRQCSSVDKDMLENFYKMEDVAQTKKTLKEASSGSSANIPLPKFGDFGKKRKWDNNISKSFNVVPRDELDHLIARIFYASGLSFNLIRSPYFRQMIKHACDSQLKGYVVPTYDRLRTTLLQAEKAKVELHLKSIRQSWTHKGVSIVSDGWIDSNRKRSLINFMAASENDPVFLKAVDATEEVKSAEYVGKLFLEVISEVGHENVVQLITNNAAAWRAADLRVEAKHPSIFWTPCIFHTLSLALKNIFTPGKNMSESATFTIYNKYSKLKLLGVTETRFVSTLILVKRIFQVKSALQRMVIDESWRFYREEDSQKAYKIKDILVSDLWWDNVEYLLEFSELIFSMLRVADTNTPMLHLVYEKWNSMIEEIRKKVREEYGKFAAAISNFGRWEALSERYTINPLALWGVMDLMHPHSQAMHSEDLVYVHSNLRHLSRVDEHYVEGLSKYWDAVGDEFNLEGPLDLKFANLSLDDPVLESMSFEDDEMSNNNVDLDSITEENIGNQIDGSN
ncbi:hypothetical protein HHK36_013067 [Tetracentron sinense]|uniref:DUF659 domain-containing protein n=1 Tax=Tetracentron sinense TaxID=13715 RepID=A0A834ZAG8_TETSI|nr:hypothetical protein HHK36_013067 [Tetracentron sinense]